MSLRIATSLSAPNAPPTRRPINRPPEGVNYTLNNITIGAPDPLVSPRRSPDTSSLSPLRGAVSIIGGISAPDPLVSPRRSPDTSSLSPPRGAVSIIGNISAPSPWPVAPRSPDTSSLSPPRGAVGFRSSIDAPERQFVDNATVQMVGCGRAVLPAPGAPPLPMSPVDPAAGHIGNRGILAAPDLQNQVASISFSTQVVPFAAAAAHFAAPVLPAASLGQATFQATLVPTADAKRIYDFVLATLLLINAWGIKHYRHPQPPLDVSTSWEEMKISWWHQGESPEHDERYIGMVKQMSPAQLASPQLLQDITLFSLLTVRPWLQHTYGQSTLQTLTVSEKMSDDDSASSTDPTHSHEETSPMETDVAPADAETPYECEEVKVYPELVDMLQRSVSPVLKVDSPSPEQDPMSIDFG